MSEATRRVYRIENEQGYGPYTAGATLSLSISESHNDGDHPIAWGWSADIPDWETDKGMRVACPSLKKLEDWFSGWGSLLDTDGFQLATYEVSEQHFFSSLSGKQCAFTAGEARPLSIEPITFE